MSLDSISIVESYVQSYNVFDIEGMILNLHEDVEFENYAGGILNLELKGIENFEKQARKAANLFKERRQQIDSVVAKQNTVLIQITYSGILAQDLANGLKAGSKLEMEGSSIFTFVGHKIIKIQDYS